MILGDCMIHVYSLPVCPKCKTLKAYLEREKIAYLSADLDPAAITDMRCSGFFGMSAPIIMRRPGEYYGPEEFFEGDRLDERKLRELIA